MLFGALIVGDEILSGRRVDRHLPKLIELLGERGLRLGWARYVGDDAELLVRTLQQTFTTGDAVFSFGGIGATPDDRTRQSAAAALGVPLALHPQAEALLRAKFGEAITPHRLQLGTFPVGSDIIPNPFNQVPGFSIRNHFFVPGFPVMSWPMVEWVLDTRFRALHHADDHVEAAITVWDALEGQLIDLMESIGDAHPPVSVFSLPSVPEAPGDRRSIELGVKGPARQVAEAMSVIKAEVVERGFEWQDRP